MPSTVDVDVHRRPRSARALERVLRFELRALVLGATAWLLVLGSAPWSVSLVDAAEPKVVIVVGPTGSITDAYRSDGERAAAAARTFTSQVVTVFSPDATWPAVREALQGASVVVYLGHGNGWPSPYSDTPRPSTQNGLGLNPVAGVDDIAHQYFGEAYLASDVRLAPHAVVLLHHLCYASGHPEPGMPEGSFEVIRQRVEGYASGWIAAGADAVIADSSNLGPATYIDRILSGRGTIESIWRSVPSYHGHVAGVTDRRDAGFSILLDPTQPQSGYYRSIVGRLQLSAKDVAAGARSARANDPQPTPGSIAEPVVIDAPTLDGRPVAGSTAQVSVAFASASSHPAGLQLGFRWDPLAVDDPAATLAQPAPSPSTGPSPSPSQVDSAVGLDVSPSPSATAAADPSPSEPGVLEGTGSAPLDPVPSPSASGQGTLDRGPADRVDAPPPVALVQPEEQGAVVVVAQTTRTDAGLVASTDVPTESGLYRLDVSIHGPDGSVLDDVRQTGASGLLVRVAATASMAIAVPPRLDVPAGSTTDVTVTVSNTGAAAWAPIGSSVGVDGMDLPTPVEAVLLGHWIALDGAPESAAAAAGESIVRLEGQAEAGADMTVALPLTAPSDPGRYLLVLDVITPGHGSLIATGSGPVEDRVAVGRPSPTTPEHTR